MKPDAPHDAATDAGPAVFSTLAVADWARSGRWVFVGVLVVLAPFLALVSETLIHLLPGHRGLVMASVANLAGLLILLLVANAVFSHALRRMDRSNRRLAEITRLDPMTGIANRSEFEARLKDMIADHPGPAGTVSCLIIDLDGFKPINDSFGHSIGDAVLREAARRLKEECRSAAVVARLGGDEFAIADPGAGSLTDATAIARRVIAGLSEPVQTAAGSLTVGATVGIALQSDVGSTASDLINAADAAMYRAKAAGRGRYDIHVASPRQDGADGVDAKALELALRLGQISPHYQPIVDLATGRICGFEALARWDHPTRGLLLPESFLGAISANRLQGLFTSVIARQVFSDVNGWVARGLSPRGISINVSQEILATSFAVEEMEWLMAEFPAVRDLVTIEITEAVFVARSADRILANLRSLSKMGLDLSVDDFGTGFGSFRHLAGSQMSEIKIDREFVNLIGKSQSIERVIEGFLSIARGLGIVAVAEGVETAEQARFLASRGCPRAQGFLFGRVTPADQVPDRFLAGPGATTAFLDLLAEAG